MASHIKPWADFPEDRLNLRNGLCLSSIHDSAFDAGLITFGPGFEMMLSGVLRSMAGAPSVDAFFTAYEGRSISMPEKLAEPSPEFLEYHRKELFVG